MEITTTTLDILNVKTDCLALFVHEGFKTDIVSTLDKKLGGILLDRAKAEHFEGKAGQILIISTHSKIPSNFIVLVGVGKASDLTPYLLRKSSASIIQAVAKRGVKKLSISALPQVVKKYPFKGLVQGVIEGLLLGDYKFLKYKGEKAKTKTKKIESVEFVVNKKNIEKTKEQIKIGEIFSHATIFARDLVNEPSSFATPSHLALIAKDLGKNPQITCEVFDKKEISELGMHAFLSVNRGSDEPPKLIKLRYKPSRAKKPFGKSQGKRIVLIGKGITFDTGGLSIKPSKGMETMKMDMAGAASVLGVFQALSQLKPKVEVVGLIAATDNMPSGKATKPGDIVRAHNGKFIEILNTDAEGRMTLADMLSYARQENPSAIIDLATLTGACLVALGQDIAGLFGNNEKLVDQIRLASQKAGEKVWQLPLEDEYKELVKSDVADLRNTSKTRYGGTITAALFLQEFVPNGTPWVHLDIAGPAFEEKGNPIVPKGGSGFGVRTILSWLLSF